MRTVEEKGLPIFAQGLDVVRQGVAQPLCPFYELPCQTMLSDVDSKVSTAMLLGYLSHNIQEIFCGSSTDIF